MQNLFITYKSAFLHGNQIYREVYLKSSSEAGAQKLCRLNISVYGLCVDPRVRYLSLKPVLKNVEQRKI